MIMNILYYTQNNGLRMCALYCSRLVYSNNSRLV